MRNTVRSGGWDEAIRCVQKRLVEKFGPQCLVKNQNRAKPSTSFFYYIKWIMIERYTVKVDTCGKHSSNIELVNLALKSRKGVGCWKNGKKKSIPEPCNPGNTRKKKPKWKRWSRENEAIAWRWTNDCRFKVLDGLFADRKQFCRTDILCFRWKNHMWKMIWP